MTTDCTSTFPKARRFIRVIVGCNLVVLESIDNESKLACGTNSIHFSVDEVN